MERDPIQAHLDSLSTEDLSSIRESLLESHAKLTKDLDRVESALLRKNQPEFDYSGRSNYEHTLGQAVLRGEIDAEEAYDALRRFEA